MKFNQSILLLFLMGSSSFCFSQIKIRLHVKVEDTSFHEDKIYLAGQLNGWTPCSPDFALNKTSEGNYFAEYAINSDWKKMVFKFTSCGWNRVESDSNNADVPNRTIQADKSSDYNFSVHHFRNNPAPAELESTLTGNRSSSVWISTDSKTKVSDTINVFYWQPTEQVMGTPKVLYLFDAQNLFDVKENSQAEWQIDETLTAINKQYGPFYVVAMSHRGVRRISDYTPYKNAEYPTGYGKRIAEIIAENIGSSERALGIKDVKLENRVIGGSSLGGIMSAYAVANNPTIFGKAVVFSPAFYINPELLEYLARSNSANSKSKIAIWAGGSESETMVPLTEKYGAILDKNKINHNLIIDPNGQHNEANWAVAFPSAIKFLFGK